LTLFLVFFPKRERYHKHGHLNETILRNQITIKIKTTLEETITIMPFIITL